MVEFEQAINRTVAYSTPTAQPRSNILQPLTRILRQRFQKNKTAKDCIDVELFEGRVKLFYPDGPAHRLLPDATSKLVTNSFQLVLFGRSTVTVIG